MPELSSSSRPTQAYYVPRRLLEGGRGPYPASDGKPSSPDGFTSLDTPPKTPKSRPNTEVRASERYDLTPLTRLPGPRGETFDDPPPLDAGAHTVEQNRRQVIHRAASADGRSPTETRFSKGERTPQTASATTTACEQMIQEKRRTPRYPPSQPPAASFTSAAQPPPRASPPKPFAPRIVNGPRGPLSRPNAFCAVSFPLKDTCICDRPKSHVICKRFVTSVITSAFDSNI